MIKDILLIFVFNLIFISVNGQISQNHEDINHFDESLFLHVISQGNLPDENLMNSYESNNEKNISETLTEYAYQHELDIKNIAALENKSIILDLVKRYITNKEYSEAQKIIQGVTVSDFDKSDGATFQFLNGYLKFIHKDFKHAQLVFDHKDAKTSKFKYQNLYYSAFCDMFSEAYESAYNKFAQLQNQGRYQNDLPYYMALMKYQLEEYAEVIHHLKNELTHSRSIYEDEMRELLSRAYYKESKWDKLSAVLLSGDNCCDTQEQHYFVGMSFYKKGDYAQAIEHLSNSTDMKTEESQNALLALGSIYANSDKQKAISYLKKAALLNYNEGLKDQALLSLGQIYGEIEKSSLALSALGRINTQSEYYDQSVEERLKILYRQEEYDKALSLIIKTDKNYHLYQDLLYRQGVKYYEANNFKKSKNHLEEASLLSSDLIIASRATHLLAKIAFDEQDDKGLSSAMNRYEEINSQRHERNIHIDSEMYYLKGCRAIDNNNFTSAISALNQSEEALKKAFRVRTQLHHEKMYEDILLRKADCYFELGLKKEAQEAYSIAYDHFVNHGDYALYQKGKIEDLLDEPYLQISTYDLLEKKFPNSKYVVDTWIKKGEILVELGKSKEAYDQFAKVYKSSIATADQKYQSLSKLGILTYNQGDVETALSFYKEIFDSQTLSQIQRTETLRAIEEIYLNDLQDSDGYFTFLEGVKTGDVPNINRDSIDYHLALEILGQERERGIKAIEDYLSVQKNGQYRVASLKELAKHYEIQNDTEIAIATYEKLMQEAPQSKQLALPRIIHNLGLIENKTTEYIASNLMLLEENFSKSLNDFAYANIAKASTKIENPVEYDKHISLALRGDKLEESEKEHIRLSLVKGYLNAKKFEESKEHLAILAKSKNDQITAESIYLIAKRLYQIGKYEEALAASNKALEKYNQNKDFVAEVILLQARIYLSMDDIEAAKTAVETILSRDNIDPRILRNGDKLQKQIKATQKEKAHAQSPTLNLQYGTHE